MNAQVVVLGMGGTIAGRLTRPDDERHYKAAQIGIEDLLSGTPEPGVSLLSEQVAQLDSKDMDFEDWRRLAERVQQHLDNPAVAGLVITHGSDTLEETAYFLQRVLAPPKPVVMTAAMRPADARDPDGPRNLRDALRLARHPGARGVLAALAGQVFAARSLRKLHPSRLTAFDGGDEGPLAEWGDGGELLCHRPWPSGEALGWERLPCEPGAWPWVEWVASHAGARPDGVRLLCAQGVDGLVFVGTGNGTLHHRLEAALVEAEAQGVAVLRSSRCLAGNALDPDSGERLLTPAQARVELICRCIERRSGGPSEAPTRKR